MKPVLLRPGLVELVEWRDVYRGAALTIDPVCRTAIRHGAEAVDRIVARGEPVYGVNTGFGKLASVRIAMGDLATLQRNLVLSHAAGVGEPTPAPIVRLMMALKLASLAQGASGVRPETVTMLEVMLERDLIPVVPAQGSVGASGDLAPLAHMAAAMIGASEFLVGGLAVPAARHSVRPVSSLCNSVPRKGSRCSTEPSFRPRTHWPRSLRRRFSSRAPWSPVRCRPRRPRARIRRSTTESTVCAVIGARSTTAEAIRRLMAGSAIRASHLIGDARVQDPYCLAVSRK